MVSGALRREWQRDHRVLRVRSEKDVESIEALVDSTWPDYAVYGHPPESAAYLVDWPKLYELWPDFQFGLVEPHSGTLIASGNSLPLAWHGTAEELPDQGWDWAMHTGRVQQAVGEPPNCLIPIAITVAREWRGLGVSRRCLEILKEIALDHGLTRMFAPVRPSRKSDHPQVPIEEYVQWKTIDGRMFDPWLRTHISHGGRVVQPCRQSMTFQAPLDDWKQWTGVKKLRNGPQDAPDLLSQLVVDVQRNVGLYVEPNVWVEHPLSGPTARKGISVRQVDMAS